ncbi:MULTISPECIES: NEL-type E3 ubiquitin ligase domain-containing protein [unclassified Pseudomonas]|uniref:NEL-type E3 ubiquitin ligase domain-containing protein n=1 Tax=unclassified Pseudomonas TaxID=196821 RepID=UPI0004864ECC|nr:MULTISPECIES: NEL-type E3 ubiquitin ligase domain-containing protein [unclassified Pseudomonas]RAS21829.1 leucine rich repeat (LRR) protein [Pseudomonas sp. URMO17WK12:I7]SMF64367.1 Leucine rich repeat-containing protein [Pseudomonas sp. URMO17WK12:I5]
MTDSPEHDLPPDSIDALIAKQMPEWLKNASGEARKALHLSLIQQQQSAEHLKRLLSGIPDLIAFCAPQLEEALYKEHNIHVDVRTAQLCTVVRRSYPSIFPLPPIERTVRTNAIPLLSAAMHNFAEDEIVTRPRIRRQLEAPSGAKLPISFVLFAKLCHALDLGGRYQSLLRQHLLPADKAGDPPGHARREVEAVFEEAQRTALEAAVRVAFVRADIDERSYLQMLRVIATKPTVPADTTLLACRELFLLGKCIQGVVVVEWREQGGTNPAGLIVWIPGDADRPVRQHASWAALYEDLGLRLREPSYATFFMRFIGERERMAFSSTLERLLAKAATGAALELDGRHFALDKPLFAHLRSQHIDKILDDARVLAVPSKDEDAASRSRRLANYENAGLTLLGLAGLFIPVLGELMLGVAALQIADEVYEGYQDWQLGDREAALGHVFAIAENLAVGAAVGAGAAIVKKLTPVLLDAGRLRLCSLDMAPYQIEQPPGVSVVQGEGYLGRTQVQFHEGTFQIARSQDGKDLVIRHPTREQAYRPLLRRNGSGAWRHALELPQEWVGELQLLRRLAAAFFEMTPEEATAVLDCTGFDEARLRQLHVENAPAPARLRDAFDRYRLHVLHPAMEAEAFELLVAAAQEREEVEDALIRRTFPGLSVRGAKEIRQQVDNQLLEQLRSSGRVPLAMAERIRWYLRDSRLDRACAGLRQWQAVNGDTERLAIGLIHELAPWPEALRVELREGSAQGALLAQAGAEAAQEVIGIVRGEHTYSIHDQAVHPRTPAGPTYSLMHALLLCMDDQQKIILGNAMLGEQQLVDRLAGHVRGHRDLASRLIGQVPISGGVRPPLRFADGRLGYPLSGRGESRGQAARRGILQVYPTLDDAQLQQYMLNLIAEQVDPWSHYEALYQQWMTLRSSLASWRAEYANLLDLLRRSRVANALRRCWRRKLRRRTDGSYALEISGERVGSLPQLPGGITFAHVTRLVLRDMDLQRVDADFLGRFPKLMELDLRSNRLSSIPQGLEQLTELRLLRLDNNQIALTPADSQRINTLLNLERIELNYNPLGNPPEVRRLLNVRQLGMRGAGIEQLPENIQQLPWRGIVDLRQNRIQQVNSDLLGLRVRLQQMALHDNPLDEASEALLNEQPGPSNASAHGVRHSPFYRHHLVLQAELEEWLTGTKGALRAEREMLWSNVRSEAGSDDFFNFLRDFVRLPDYLKHPTYYRARVWNIIEACEQNSELRELLFEQAGGIASCEDRLLWLFSQMETRVLVHRQTTGLTQMQSEVALMRLGRSLFRLQQVDRIAARKLAWLREVNANVPSNLERIDDIETYLAYRVRLAGPLQLPAQPVRMHYEQESFVTAQDINSARVEILSSESTEQLAQSLADQMFWQDYLRQTYFMRFRALVDAQRPAMEQYESQVESGEIDEQTYIERSNALKSNLETQETALIKRLTAEAYSRWPL